MKNSTLIKDNINNLTDLWKTVGTPFLSYHKNDSFEYCKIENSGWPNKLWFHNDISKNNVLDIRKTMHENSGLVIPYWDIFGTNSNEILDAYGFEIKSEQLAMALKLDQKFELQNNLSFKKIDNEQDSKIWSDLYPNAFGYVISKEILIHNHNNVHFYLASLDNQPIGTFMLFQTQNNIGIHGVGVIPEMRRKGLAEEIMKFALNLSIDLQADYALLQASVMGKDIYTRLGFKDLFVIKNYILKAL
ncbi:GNAT family N-acetyltransferase [Flavobacterium aquidurense]|uniref:GNAT family N-acetyltransferase n=1 Tax=Flavobacterium aquidurense TaxID=362413 RepID=UPI00091B1419|nr:GNAT family N-acetyltransferase [Flavobacterium aquidurense]OXA69716.1 GNAT family N-acetyltransferase [Flavobacterium aquidurense]SHH28363.1 Acetyltransferase (GNAT) domain-containing protein [Flavobacterium frigidimaris]